MRTKDILKSCASVLLALNVTANCIGGLPVQVYAEEVDDEIVQDETVETTAPAEGGEEAQTEPTDVPEETTAPTIPADAVLERISLKKLPTKCEYVIGQSLDLTGLVVQATYSDGSVVEVSDYQHSVPDTSSIGRKDVTITYRGKTAVFYITVVSKAVLEYRYTPPTKTQYVEGDPFDITGLSMTFLYNDGTEESPDPTYDEPDMTVAGEHTVTFRWDNHTERFTFMVALKSLEEIKISGFYRTKYKVGDELDLSGLVVTAYFTSEEPKVITDYTVSGYNAYNRGEQTVTISYGGRQASFVVVVEDIQHYVCYGGEGCPSNGFIDVDYHLWYHEGIDFVVNRGLMVGVTDKTFAPDVSTTRAMIVTILYRLSGSPEVDDSAGSFKDVPKGSWYSKAVAWASKNGIVSGYGGGKFGPNDRITREQMAAMMYRYAQFIGMDTSDRADISSMPDAGSISGWAKEAMAWTYARGMIVGIPQSDHVTMIEPKGNATRAQVAAIIYRFCENVSG